ncbi:MAG: radical SAM protein [Pseudonocardiaceae bacterium]
MRYNTLGIQVTNTCNMTCGHCITDSSPTARGDLTWPQIEAAIRSVGPHVDGVCVTGGEPLLRRDLTLRTIRLTRFHDRIVSGTSLDMLLATGAGTSIETQVQYCGDRTDEAYRIAEQMAAHHGATLQTAEVLPFGRGRQLAIRRGVDVATVPDDPCGIAVRPVLTPEGELFTCCGPARGAAPNSPLRLRTQTTGEVGAALAEGATNPILNLIHSKGPVHFSIA